MSPIMALTKIVDTKNEERERGVVSWGNNWMLKMLKMLKMLEMLEMMLEMLEMLEILEGSAQAREADAQPQSPIQSCTSSIAFLRL